MQNLSKNEGISIENQSKKMLEETAIYVYIIFNNSGNGRFDRF